jgi:hypothetical protein
MAATLSSEENQNREVFGIGSTQNSGPDLLVTEKLFFGLFSVEFGQDRLFLVEGCLTHPIFIATRSITEQRIFSLVCFEQSLA